MYMWLTISTVCVTLWILHRLIRTRDKGSALLNEEQPKIEGKPKNDWKPKKKAQEASDPPSGGAECKPHQYDVFINHRGPDVKKTFVAHLNAALRRDGFRPFLDAEDIGQGHPVFNSIDEALNGACVHVAVFSKRYAESKYCLNELCDMLNSGQVLLPVLFDVNPEDFWRVEKGPFKEGFQKHIKCGRVEEVQKWKEALRTVAGLWAFRLDEVNGNESKLISSILEEVRKAIPPTLLPGKLKEKVREPSDPPSGVYDVFINHRGPDVKKKFAAHLNAALQRDGFRPFLDAKDIGRGQPMFKSIDEALKGACVHVAIFSKRYAESKFCLNELCDMLKSKKVILPVFFDINQEDLRWVEKGPLKEGFQKHLKLGRDYEVEKWKEALGNVADYRGFQLDEVNSDESQLISSILEGVRNAMPSTLLPGKPKKKAQEAFDPPSGVYDVFINHHGPDVKKTFVAHLNAALRRDGFRPFLDTKDIGQGHPVFNSIDEAPLNGACVYVAIFSKRYAESEYCLNELCDMLESGQVILPVFFDVNPEDLRWIEKGPFKKGFEKHMKCRRRAEVEKWEEALCEVADFRGFRLDEVNGDESQLISNILEEVRKAMPPTLLQGKSNKA